MNDKWKTERLQYLQELGWMEKMATFEEGPRLVSLSITLLLNDMFGLLELEFP
jgi:hypothetical protein